MKSTLDIYDNIDINKYTKVIAFLKRKNDNYTPKKSKTLSIDNITQFFSTAEDDDYLMFKVVVIVALHGACRRCELLKLTVNDIQDTGTLLLITLNNTKNKTSRSFTVTADLNGYELCKKYMNLRPTNVNHNRFFLFYKQGQCTVQPVGTNILAKIPQKIALFLKLSGASEYTGHCLRRTSASLLANSGADILRLKRHGGWPSSGVAKGYIDDSVSNKLNNSKDIFKEALESTSSNKKCDKDIIKAGIFNEPLQSTTLPKNTCDEDIIKVDI